MTRAERAGFEAAKAVFEAEGVTFRVRRGRHLLLVTAYGSVAVSGTPRTDEVEQANYARQDARAVVRRAKGCAR